MQQRRVARCEQKPIVTRGPGYAAAKLFRGTLYETAKGEIRDEVEEVFRRVSVGPCFRGNWHFP
jgi:hypothetical protein